MFVVALVKNEFAQSSAVREIVDCLQIINKAENSWSSKLAE
jgi:hypothetical protein